MKIANLMKIDMNMLRILAKHGIRMSDYKYVDVYESYLCMRSNRVKHRAAIAILAEENEISERTMERIFKRLSALVDID